MSRGLNQAILLGNVGGDPESKTLPNGTRAVGFSLATSRQYTRDGERHEKTEWHRCVAYSRGQGTGVADVVAQYAKRGTRLLVQGEITYREYTDREGQQRQVTEIRVEEVLLRGDGGESRSAQASTGASATRRASERARQQQLRQQSQQPARDKSVPAQRQPQPPLEDYTDEPDDLPF